MNKELARIRQITSHISFEIFNTKFFLTSDIDKKGGNRVYLQVIYTTKCTKTQELCQQKGGKHYLSEHMTEDEIVKRCYVAFESAVKHEVMEGFRFDDIIVFNPHVDFRKLLEVSPHEVSRTPIFDT